MPFSVTVRALANQQADVSEMGLGKTLQTIALLTELKFGRQVEGPHLVVAPLSVIDNWIAECARWSPELKVFRFHANEQMRTDLKVRR